MNTQWELPNPFIKADGSEIACTSEWPAQQEALKQILAEDFYGIQPPAPGNVKAEKQSEQVLWDGKGLFEVFELSFGPEESVKMRVAVIRDAAASVLPIPVVLCGGFVAEDIACMAVSRGFAIITPLCDDAAPDNPNYKEGSLYKAYPEYSFKVISMWGWLMSRTIDWLETTDFVDVEKIVIVGHSRFGKAALACAVYDERVKVCAAGGSGCGGIGSLRLGGGRLGNGNGDVETLGGMITGYFPHWLLDSLVPYGAKEPSAHYRENELRFDANFIGAAIAPRPLILVEGLDDTWANPFGTFCSWSATAEVYHFLDADEKCAIHFREGGHALNMEDWETFLDFAKVQLLGEEKKTNYKTWSADGPVVGRSWTAPGFEPVVNKNNAMTPEMLQRLKASFSQKWAFGAAGLETGIDKFMRMMIAEAEKKLQ